MKKGILLILLISIALVQFSNTLPVNDDEASILYLKDLIENSIDDDDDSIDLSSLGPEAFGSPINESGEALATWNESSLMNAEEMGGYAEGDILIPHYTRNGIREKSSRWENGIIPYVIQGSYNQNQRDEIMKAIADYHRLTCLRFVPYNGQTDYLVIKSANSGCWSSVGRLGGRQEVNLQAPGCVSKKGTILHELLHAIGFLHEQSRPERDDFVTIHYGNIKSGSENNFKKADPKGTNDFGISYDYNSVMHYSQHAFSKNSQPTIVPKMDSVKLGQREGLSRGDVKKVNLMYNCKKDYVITVILYWVVIVFSVSSGITYIEPTTGWLGQIWQNFFGNKTKRSNMI